MKKLLIIGLCIGTVALSAICFWGRSTVSLSQPFQQMAAVGAPLASTTDEYTHTKVSINGTVFSVFVANTPELRQKGLSGFNGLAKHEAMFFVFDKAEKQGFWMRDMLFPLDIVWIDAAMKVVHIEKNISPNTYPHVFESNTPAQFVIEFASGTTDRLGTKKGDVVLVSGGK